MNGSVWTKKSKQAHYGKVDLRGRWGEGERDEGVYEGNPGAQRAKVSLETEHE